MPFSLDTGSMMQIIWLVLLVVFAASEAATVGLTSIWFAWLPRCWAGPCGCRSPCSWR